MAENERRLHIAGIHHITLISGNLERSAAFYRDLLGLRLVEAGRRTTTTRMRGTSGSAATTARRARS